MHRTKRATTPRFTAVVASVFLALSSRTAGADGQLYLTWEGCAANGIHDQSNVCLINVGSTPLYTAFVLDVPIDDVVGIQVTIDLQHSAPAMPDWWRMQGAGDCRDGALHVSGVFGVEEAACSDPWRGLGGGEVLYDVGVAPRSPSQAHLIGTWAIPADSARTLSAGVMYHGLKFLIDNTRSVFPGECVGCNQPVCLVLNRIELLREFGATPPVVALELSGPDDAHRATWKGGAGASCEAVPVRSRTWGQIKSLYR